MALALTTITNSIAALSVTGVTIKDIDEIPEAVDPRAPTIYPLPDGFVSNFVMVRDSFGTGTIAKMTVSYNLTYRFCYCPIGSGRGLLEYYDDTLTKAMLFLDAILANDWVSGLVDLTPADALNFGPVADPAGNAFHGCDFILMVTEFVN